MNCDYDGTWLYDIFQPPTGYVWADLAEIPIPLPCFKVHISHLKCQAYANHPLIAAHTKLSVLLSTNNICKMCTAILPIYEGNPPVTKG